MKKQLYEEPTAEVLYFSYEYPILSGQGDPWVVINEVMMFVEEEEYYEESEDL